MYPAAAIAHQLLLALKMMSNLKVTGYGFVFLFLRLKTELKTWAICSVEYFCIDGA